MASEVEALKAIYCGSGEFIVHQKSTDSSGCVDTIFTVLLKSDDQQEQLSATYTLSKDYPHQCPGLSVASSDLTKESCNRIRNDVLKYGEGLVPQPMIMDLNMWIQQNMSSYRKQVQSVQGPAETEQMWLTLLSLDHMRSKSKYIKTIQKWTSELGLTGHLIFVDKDILILLCGSQESIKGYVKRQKTVNVDVDSKGRNCKERMLTVLTEQPLNTPVMFIGFSVLDVTRAELKGLFETWSLSEVYAEYIRN